MLVYDIEYSYTEFPWGSIINSMDVYIGVYIVEIKTYIPNKQCCTLPTVQKSYIAVDPNGNEHDIELTEISIIRAYDDVTNEDYTLFYLCNPITIRESR